MTAKGVFEKGNFPILLNLKPAFGDKLFRLRLAIEDFPHDS